MTGPANTTYPERPNTPGDMPAALNGQKIFCDALREMPLINIFFSLFIDSFFLF